MNTILWAASPTSSNPPPTFSDVFSLSGTSTFSAQLTSHGTTGGLGNGISGNVQMYASTNGISYSAVGSPASVIAGPSSTRVATMSSVSTGSYSFAKIHFAPGVYDTGFFDTGTWSTTALVLPVSGGGFGGGGVPGFLNRSVAIGTAGNSNPFGVDILNQSDLDPYFSLVGGIQSLAQDMFHRLISPPGSVPGAPDFGFDCRSMLNQSMTNTTLALIQSEMTIQLQADERVQSASVALTFDFNTNALTITATVLPLNPQLSPQPFQFIASISSIGANLLSISPGFS